MTLAGWESVFFWVFGLAALVAGLLTIMARNAVHAALFLISALVSVAALFVLLGAEFIAGVQILVYVGGVMVLFLFVIMLVNVGAEEREEETPFNRTPQVAAAVVFCALLGFGLISVISRAGGQFNAAGADPSMPAAARAAAERRARAERDAALPAAATGVSKMSADTQAVGASLFRYAGLPFEIASVLLLVAIVGSVLLSRTSKQELAADDMDPEVLPELSLAEPELLDAVDALAPQGRGPAAEKVS
jgi:NADH-quinone oxidoreductase subunit J